jgi:hypothetical protein
MVQTAAVLVCLRLGRVPQSFAFFLKRAGFRSIAKYPRGGFGERPRLQRLKLTPTSSRAIFAL